MVPISILSGPRRIERIDLKTGYPNAVGSVPDYPDNGCNTKTIHQ